MSCCQLLDTRDSWTAPSVPRTSVAPCHSILTQMAFRNPVAITSPVCQQCAAGRHFAKFDEPIPKRKLPVDGSQLPMGITFGGADERSGVAVATTSRRVIVRSAQTLTCIKSASRRLSRRSSHCCKQVFTKGKLLFSNKHKVNCCNVNVWRIKIIRWKKSIAELNGKKLNGILVVGFG